MVFDDLFLCEDSLFRKALVNCSLEDLSLSLKTATTDMTNKFTKNMDREHVKHLNNKLKLLGPVRVIDVENAQARIVRIFNDLNDEGE